MTTYKNDTANEFKQFQYQSPIGAIFLVFSQKALTGVFLEKQGNIPLNNDKVINGFPLFNQAVKEFEEYFSKKRKKFSLPLDFSGTDFQKKVWLELQKIPFGKTLSYKELAIKINHRKAYRAVGSANGKNPLCIVIPCHRVISADGSLGGYSGGLDWKRKLLALENEMIK